MSTRLTPLLKPAQSADRQIMILRQTSKASSSSTPRHPKRRIRLTNLRPRVLKPMNINLKRDLLNAPNLLTMLRIVLIPFVFAFLAYQTPFFCILATVFFGIAAITDFFDGYLARKLNLVSVTGKFLDPLADKLMVMAATIQLASLGWLEAWVPILLLGRELIVQGLRQIAVAEGMVIAAGTGGKLKTAFQLVGLVGLLLHYTYPVSIFGFESSINFHRTGWYLLILSIFFSLQSAWQYFSAFLDAIKGQNAA